MTKSQIEIFVRTTSHLWALLGNLFSNLRFAFSWIACKFKLKTDIKSAGQMPLSCLSHMLTGPPRDAHFHRPCCVQSGSVDHDTQHPQARRSVCLQVGSQRLMNNEEVWFKRVLELKGTCDWSPSQHVWQLPVPQRNEEPRGKDRVQDEHLLREHEQRRPLDAGELN